MECRGSTTKVFYVWRHRQFALTINPGCPWCVHNWAFRDYRLENYRTKKADIPSGQIDEYAATAITYLRTPFEG
jgi:hypothetical protein